MSEPGEPLALAVDVGGTAIKGLLVDGAGRQVLAAETTTPVGDGPDAVVAAVRSFCLELAARSTHHSGAPLRAAGLVVPGSVDAEAGIARYSANLGWRDVPLRELVGNDLGIPVVLDHDVWSAALAERTLGAARDEDDCIVVVIGTGIAAVSVAGGREIRGATGHAGELGHVPVRPGGEPCACGQHGCLEAYASAAAIARRYRAESGVARSAAEVAGLLGDDPVATRVWADAVETLGIALVTTTMLDDPALVVISGGLSAAGDVLLTPLRAAVEGGLCWRPAPRIALSPLGVLAGRWGAAVLAWRAAGVGDFTGWGVP